MRKIPTNENAGRSSPTLTPTTPNGSAPNILWGSGAGIKATTPVASDQHSSNSMLQPRESANPSSAGAANGPSSGWASSSAQESSQYKYSREFILSLFDPAIPVPPDYEPAGVMTSDRALEPMANIPLNENEKKLFTSQSVNSEISARRTPYGRGETKEGVVRPPRAPGTAQRGYSNRIDRGGSQSDGYRPTRKADATGDEDPWDIPAGVGSFSGNGFFSREDEANAARNGPNEGAREDSMLHNSRGRESPARSASPVSDRRSVSPGKGSRRAPSPLKAAPTTQGQTSSVANGGMSTAAAAPTSSTASAQHGRSNEGTGQSRTSFVDMFSTFGSSPLGTPMVLPNSSSSLKADMSLGLGKLSSEPIIPPIMTRSLSKNDLLQTPVQNSLPPPGIIPAPTPFVAQQWQYKDPSGSIQGPFTAGQMQDWFRSGYFNDDLPIKRVEDYNYEPLARLLLKHGRDRPFLADLEEAELRHQQLESQKRMPAPNPTAFVGMYQNEVSTPGSMGYNAFGTFGTGAGTPSLYTANAANADPFSSLGRDRFGTGGYDPLSAGGYGRTSWGETPALSRGGWSGLNTDLGSPFNRPAAAPGSPAGSLQSSYFDTRGALQTQDGYGGGVSNQRAASSFAPFSGPQAPQSPATNLFSGQPILDFTASQIARGSQPEWGGMQGLVGSHYHEDGHAPLDVISKLIDESHYETEEMAAQEKQGLDEPNVKQVEDEFADLSVAPVAESLSQEAKAADEPQSPVKQEKGVEKHVGKARKTRKEERQERFERENELRKEQSKQTAEKAERKPTESAAVDLRQIISEQESRSKQEKEQAQLERNKQMQREIEEAEQMAGVSPSAWASGTTDQPKLSLKQIQEIEQKRRALEESERSRRAHEAMIQQAQMLQEQDALSASQSWAKEQAQGGAVWGSTAKPQPARQKSLAEIMEEEEKRKRKEADLRGVQIADVVMPTGSGKRYADTISTVGNSSTIAWGLAAAGARPPVVNRPAAVIATGNVVKATPPVAAAGRPDESVIGAWNVVGKQGQVVRPPAPVARTAAVPAPRPVAPVAPRIVSVQVSSTPAPVAPTHHDSSKGPSSAFMQWCRSALRPLERSTSAGVNVDDFIGILLSISIHEPAITQSICDDILGGLTAIDPRKFADEFIRKRKADASGSSLTAASATEGGWTSVGSGAVAPQPVQTLDSFDSGNKFVVVGKQNKKKKGKKV
ncbi:hypothetical protein PhCBS80983_g04675 [Powellomyces hirtus]|uniref:GYF domain-containing protein n=1 Tax=Powellomyces hirtus TaxID=109895 RepID=A0A507DWV0_9FUNG|nr:hypothetical protein PhCBS80983_g04675 [Powellomyces hirtus]